jgi:hypothetical protein
MNRTIISLLLACFSATLFAQKIRGTVTDENGTPISYVNVGIVGRSGGSVSDSQGQFSFVLPDSLRGDMEISFSHLSYATTKKNISELRQFTSAHEHIVVKIPAISHVMEEIVIRPTTKKHRHVKRGFPIPGYAQFSVLGEEVGSKLSVDIPVFVSKVIFTISTNSYEKLKLRVNFYRADAGTNSLKNILQSPIYCDIPHNEKKQRIEVKPAESIVLKKGEYYISLEFVEYEGRGVAQFPIFLSKSYHRSCSMAPLEELPVNIGLAVEGLEFLR